MKNLGYTFYKEYFKNLEFNPGDHGEFVPKLKERETIALIEDLFKSKLADYHPPVIDTVKDCFELITIYPGLLIGSGYNHEIGKQENELKLGFFFDHTTGLPCVPGSSVKGVLRDACEKDNGGYAVSIIEELKGEKELKEEVKKSLKEIDPQKIFLKTGNQPSEFVNIVFIGEDKGGYLSFKKRDIFFDAFPVVSKNENGKFLANDYITPHKHPSNPKMDPFTDPKPIQFLKVLPQVTFQFNFRLTSGCIPKDVKLELFRQIILDLGVGAKTNVGYGQFIE